MYRCESCGHLFEDGEQVEFIEPHGEKIWVCPLCQDTYQEIEPCPICNGYEHDVEETYCEKCKADVLKRFQTFVNAEFTAEERAFLNEAYEGEWI